MDHESHLRSRLQAQADALDMQGGGVAQVIRRAHRLQRRRRGAAAVMTVGALAVATAGVVRFTTDRSEDATSVATGEIRLPDTGPLDLTWHQTDGGVTMVTEHVEMPDGTLYALSTAPGARWAPGGDPAKALQQAIYRLSDDGTWEPTVQGEGNRRIASMAASGTGGLLYAMGTAPAPNGSSYVPTVSTSTDGGSSWQGEDLPSPAVDPPSDAIHWTASSNLAVESVPGATVALMSTMFVPDLQGITDEVRELVPDGNLMVERWDEGIAYVTYPHESGAATATTVAGGGVDQGERQLLRLVPWGDIGVEGRQDLEPVSTLFVRDEDGWAPTTPPVDGAWVYEVTALGDEIVLLTSSTSEHELGSTRGFASSDGREWREITTPDARGAVLASLGDIWLSLSFGDLSTDSQALHASTDGGRTWHPIDLSGVEALDGTGTVVAADAGPLGLAIVTRQEDGAFHIGSTRDLVNWTVTPLEQLAGPTANTMPTVVVGSDRVVVTVTLASPGQDTDAPAPTVTLVGTPTRP